MYWNVRPLLGDFGGRVGNFRFLLGSQVKDLASYKEGRSNDPKADLIQQKWRAEIGTLGPVH